MSFDFFVCALYCFLCSLLPTIGVIQRSIMLSDWFFSDDSYFVFFGCRYFGVQYGFPPYTNGSFIDVSFLYNFWIYRGVVTPFILLATIQLYVDLGLCVRLTIFLLMICRVRLIISEIFLPFFGSYLTP